MEPLILEEHFTVILGQGMEMFLQPLFFFWDLG
jgi:hypothetical protein